MGVYTNCLRYQKIRLREGKLHPGLQNKVSWTEFKVPIWPDKDMTGRNREVVLWEDVLLFVPTAKKQLLLNNADLGFCRGTDREEQNPVRFEARPEDVIDVIGA